MAQTALVYTDGLSPGLLPMLSEGATCILQHRRKIVSGLYYFFSNLATISCHFSKQAEYDVFPFLLHPQGRQYRSCGCFFPFMSTTIFFLLYDMSNVYAIFVIQFTSSPVPAFQTGSYYLLSSLILAPPSLHPHIHAITPKLYCLMISTVKHRVEAITQWYRRRNFPSSCLFTNQFLLIDPSHLSSITLRITARMANFWNRIWYIGYFEIGDTVMLIALANNHQGSESASMNNVARC